MGAFRAGGARSCWRRCPLRISVSELHRFTTRLRVSGQDSRAVFGEQIRELCSGTFATWIRSPDASFIRRFETNLASALRHDGGRRWPAVGVGGNTNAGAPSPLWFVLARRVGVAKSQRATSEATVGLPAWAVR